MTAGPASPEVVAAGTPMDLAAARRELVGVLLQRARHAVTAIFERPTVAQIPELDAASAYAERSEQESADGVLVEPESGDLDRARVTLEGLLKEMRRSAPASAEQLRELGRVALTGTPSPIEARAWASVDLIGTFDPEVLAQRTANGDQGPFAWVVAGAEFFRNFLVLVPVTFTWIGLGKAAAVYASCKQLAGSPGLLAQTPFLRLWEQGFQGVEAIECDTSRGTTYGLPLNSFQEVVFADFVVLLVLIALTVVVHFYSNLRATAGAAFARRMSDELRGLLTFCAMRLRVAVVAQDAAMLVLQASENLKDVARQFQDQAAQLMIRSEQGTGELVLRASENLATVATRFEQQAVQMMSALQARSMEAEERLAELGRSSVAVSTSALATVNKLDQVLQAVSASAEQLGRVSVDVRDQLAGSASALQSSVAQSGAQLQTVGARIDSVAGGLAEVDRSAKDLLQSWQRADRALEDTRTTVATMSEQLAALHAIENDAKDHVASMSDRFRVLDQIRKELVAIKIEQQRASERQGLPQPAWRVYGYMQAAQIGLLALVLGSVVVFGFRTFAAAEPLTTGEGTAPLIIPSGEPRSSPGLPPSVAPDRMLDRGPF